MNEGEQLKLEDLIRAKRVIDAQAGRELKEEGMTLAQQSYRYHVWKDDAASALHQLARSGRDFTADDVVQAAGLPGIGPNQSNGVGALFAQAARKRLIIRVGYTKTDRKEGHARVVSVWRGR